VPDICNVFLNEIPDGWQSTLNHKVEQERKEVKRLEELEQEQEQEERTIKNEKRLKANVRQT